MLNELNTRLMHRGIITTVLTLTLHTVVAPSSPVILLVGLAYIIFISLGQLKSADLLDSRIDSILESFKLKTSKKTATLESENTSEVGLTVKKTGRKIATFKDSAVYETVLLENNKLYEFIGTFDYEKRDRSELQLNEDEIMLNDGVIYKFVKEETGNA